MIKTITLPVCICMRCGHSWIQRVISPKKCPQCRSPYWNKARKNKKSK